MHQMLLRLYFLEKHMDHQFGQRIRRVVGGGLVTVVVIYGWVNGASCGRGVWTFVGRAVWSC